VLQGLKHDWHLRFKVLLGDVSPNVASKLDLVTKARLASQLRRIIVFESMDRQNEKLVVSAAVPTAILEIVETLLFPRIRFVKENGQSFPVNWAAVDSRQQVFHSGHLLPLALINLMVTGAIVVAQGS